MGGSKPWPLRNHSLLGVNVDSDSDFDGSVTLKKCGKPTHTILLFGKPRQLKVYSSPQSLLATVAKRSRRANEGKLKAVEFDERSLRIFLQALREKVRRRRLRK